ncbi:MAG: hypothetical protein AAGC54_09135 [Cyanobacteria bacterium P01_F01_bin.4]
MALQPSVTNRQTLANRPVNIAPQTLTTLVHFATLAPSGHNTQPWKFAIGENTIRLYPDFARRLPVVDPDDHALYISLGCALENLLIAARHYGLEADVSLFPDGADSANPDSNCIVVQLTQTITGPPVEKTEDPRFDAIPKRQTTRCAYDGYPLPEDDLVHLTRAAEQPGIQSRVMTAPQDIERMVGFIEKGNRLQFRDTGFVKELISWIRFNHGEVVNRHDGMTAAMMGLPRVNIPRWLGQTLMKIRATPDAQAKQFAALTRRSPVLMLFIAEKNDKAHWVNLGRSFERVALTATVLDIKHAHVNMPCEVLSVRAKLRQQLGLAEEAQPLLLIRLGYSEAMPYSPRRPLQQVLR